MAEDVNKIANDLAMRGKTSPDMNHIKCQSGYAGMDTMRAKAIRDFAHEHSMLLKGSDHPASFSAVSRTPLRKY